MTPFASRSLPLAGIKRGIRTAVASCYYGLGLYALAPRGRVFLLMYHRVLPDGSPLISTLQPGMYVTQSSFESQILYLRTHYEILSFQDLLSAWERRSLDARKRYCVLTFDDGWADTYSYAFPVLKQHCVPATIFLATSYVGSSRLFWTDRLSRVLSEAFHRPLSITERRVLLELAHGMKAPPLRPLFDPSRGSPRTPFVHLLDQTIEAFKAFPADDVETFIDRCADLLRIDFPGERAFLSWDEVGEMSRHGMTFGSHTVTHPILTQLPLEQVARELRESLVALQARPIAAIPVFCYPNGDSDENIKALVMKAGYAAAVSVGGGAEMGQPHDLFALRRMGVHNDVSRTPPLFSLHLSGLLTSSYRR